MQSLSKNAGLSLSDDQIAQLEQFADLVSEKNKVLNLTSIRDRRELLIKQILNSLLLGKFIKLAPGIQVADLGTGGGFPGIPLAIAYPKTHFFLVDSVQKKIRAVQEFSDQLNLKNISVLSERLEMIGQDKKYRERFDVVTALALAPLPVLLELAMPLVKVGGVFAAFKGPNYLEEINQAHTAMKVLKLDLPNVEPYELPFDMGKRFLLLFKKSKSTPAAYPRKVGTPNKSPL